MLKDTRDNEEAKIFGIIMYCPKCKSIQLINNQEVNGIQSILLTTTTDYGGYLKEIGLNVFCNCGELSSFED
jgi:hypothetical protein